MEARPVVLLVDDEESICRAAELTLQRAGYSPLAACNGTEALKKSRDCQGEIRLLLTDVVMPGIDGLTLTKQIVLERPHTRILLMSGGTHAPRRLPLLKKPFSLAELKESVSNAITGPPPDPADVFTGNELPGMSLVPAVTAELEAAHRMFLEKSREFLALTMDVPFGIPHPDGIALIQEKAHARKQAYADYQRALNRVRQSC